MVVLNCEAEELRLLLTFMYTGEVTAGRSALPALLQLARTLQVSGLTDADTVSYWKDETFFFLDVTYYSPGVLLTPTNHLMSYIFFKLLTC